MAYFVHTYIPGAFAFKQPPMLIKFLFRKLTSYSDDMMSQCRHLKSHMIMKVHLLSPCLTHWEQISGLPGV